MNLLIKNVLILITLLISVISESFSQDNPDSVIYMVDKWGSTTITTLSMQQQEENAIPNPFAPSTPRTINVSEMCIIFMTIYDESNIKKKQFELTAFLPGNYIIKWWAFYENLPPGIYRFTFKWLDKYEEQKIVKLE